MPYWHTNMAAVGNDTSAMSLIHIANDLWESQLYYFKVTITNLYVVFIMCYLWLGM